MTKTPLAILFDLDGTLIDSGHDLQKATNAVLQGEGLPPIDLTSLHHFLGDGLRALLTKTLAHQGRPPSEDDLKRLMPEFIRIYAAITPEKSCIYEGVEDFLGAAKARGIRLGLCTNKYESATLRILAQLGLTHYFDTIVGGDTVSECKPHPLPLQHALKALGVAPENAVMLGDHKNDVLSARGAGMKVIGARYGYSEWDGAQPDCFIDRFSDLNAALPRMVKGF